MKKVIGYIRVSTSNQDLQRQRILIQNYCDKNGYTLTRTFEDFAISGANLDRKGYNQLLNIKEGEADLIVVSELSRFSRSENYLQTANDVSALLDKSDIVMLDDTSKVYTKEDFLDVSTFIPFIFKAIGAADERKKISERMKTGKDAKVAMNPLAITESYYSIPFGFKAVENPDYVRGKTNKSQWAIDDEAMQIVKDIFTYISEGMTQQATADKVSLIYGVRISKQTVKNIIHSTVYKGIRERKGESFRMPIEQPISDDLWEKANYATTNNKLYKGNATKHFSPLKGIAKCICGRNLTIGSMPTKKGKNILLYECADRAINDSKSICKNPSMSWNLLNKIVWDIVKANYLSKEYVAKSNEAIQKLEDENYKLDDALTSKMKDKEKLESDRDTIISKGLLTTTASIMKVIEQEAAKYNAKISLVEKDIASIKKEINKNKKKIDNEKKSQITKELNDMTLEKKSEIFHQKLESVYIYSIKAKSGLVIVNFNNGLQALALWQRYNGAKIWYLPVGFQFDSDRRQIYVETLPNRKGLAFTFGSPEFKYYNYRDINKHFDLSQYEVAVPKEDLERE